MKRMHFERVLPYDAGYVLTLCNRNVTAAQIAAVREGVTCKACLASLRSSDDFAEWFARARANRAGERASE